MWLLLAALLLLLLAALLWLLLAELIHFLELLLGRDTPGAITVLRTHIAALAPTPYDPHKLAERRLGDVGEGCYSGADKHGAPGRENGHLGEERQEDGGTQRDEELRDATVGTTDGAGNSGAAGSHVLS